ncbi:uncharacterized protein LOC124645370 [Helicoverpa zea]|uniref:uncharacterized protein LOC124645370 n=1 Tax=Helicoverpa zea TaxID=7113 RepID=UPI001F58CAFB|nr:uncharacterized protein LOC124645370 [Helicoverpa zea]
MSNKMVHPVKIVIIYLFSVVNGGKHGLLLLYRPIDVSNECAFSGRLRYDLSFGMGMSDTITMVFRTINEKDYACNVDIVTQSELDVYLVVVIKFPTSISTNCHANADAFNVIKQKKCLRICDLIGSRDLYSPYFVITVKGRIRFRFLSNSSINSDISADLYQVTATSARLEPPTKCNSRNETLCVIDRQDFCFTSGVVCDGIKNCGVSDWFDERKSECSLPIEYLGYAPVIAVVGALFCALLAGGHIILRCLPPPTHSFFIFNANEDNRLNIDPLFKVSGQAAPKMEKTRRTSLIPVFSSTSSSQQSEAIEMHPASTSQTEAHSPSLSIDDQHSFMRKSTVKNVTSRLQSTLRFVASKGKKLRASLTGTEAKDDHKENI